MKNWSVDDWNSFILTCALGTVIIGVGVLFLGIGLGWVK